MSLRSLDQTSGIPIYRQIAAILEADIGKTYAVNEALPPERVLAERFGVNRHTLRHAIDVLVDKGLVARRKGSGIFVLDPPVDYAISSKTQFTASLLASGQFPQTVVLRRQNLRARAGVAARLGLKEGAPVAWIETLRLVDDRPFSIASHFIVEPYGHISIATYDGGSLHGFLRAQFGLDLRRTLSLISARLPERDDAHQLRLAPNAPILRVKSVNVNAENGKPVEYTLTRFRADRVQLAVDIAELSAFAPPEPQGIALRGAPDGPLPQDDKR